MALAQLLNKAGVPFSPFPPLPPTWASGAFTWPAPDAAVAAAATAQVEHRLHTALWWSEDGTRLFGAVASNQAEAFTIQPSSCFELLTPPQEEPHSENLGSADVSGDGRLAAVAPS